MPKDCITNFDFKNEYLFIYYCKSKSSELNHEYSKKY